MKFNKIIQRKTVKPENIQGEIPADLANAEISEELN
jgi:hypothetical protein